jgi:hypothetical protein
MSDFNPTQNGNNEQRDIPPITRHIVMCELMTLAAIFIEYNQKNPAKLAITRIQQLAQGKNLQVFKGDDYMKKLDILLKGAERLK